MQLIARPQHNRNRNDSVQVQWEEIVARFLSPERQQRFSNTFLIEAFQLVHCSTCLNIGHSLYIEGEDVQRFTLPWPRAPSRDGEPHARVRNDLELTSTAMSLVVPKSTDRLEFSKPDDQTLMAQDDTLTRALLARLREDLPQRREKIQDALLAEPVNLAEVIAQAHLLAGAAAYCNRERLMRTAAALEDAARSGDTRTLELAWLDLADALQAIEFSG